MTISTGQRWNTRRVTILALRWLIPVAIIGGFIATGQLSDAISALSRVSLVWAGPLIATGIALPISHAWRWVYLLRRTGSDVPVFESVRVTSLASLINYAAPGFLGAPAKAILVRDSRSVPLSRSLPTLAAEQLLDAGMLALAGSTVLFLSGPTMLEAIAGQVTVDDSLIALATVVAIVSVAIVMLLASRRYLPGFVERVRQATLELVSSREHIRPIAMLTLARWVLDMGAVGIASVAVGLRLGLLEILLIANLSLLVGLIAPVPGGLGVREAAMAFLAGAIGVSVPAVLALSLLHRAGLAIGLPVALGGARILEWGRR
ncbi:MAG: lysylphosphatidylglycerol synthase transmembrane domain-containing protein [Thermomicrobiaceae bacterium]